MWTIIFVGVLSALICLLTYKWATKNNNFFKDKGVKYLKPTFLIGNSGDLFWKKTSLPQSVQDWYNKFPNEKIFGMFSFTSPYFVVRDPELMKMICVKEFDHFTDHLSSIRPEIDSLLGNTLLSLQGKKWKAMRNSLSPAFTGMKMRQMYELVDNCTSAIIKSLEFDVKNAKKCTFEMKELMSNFSIDIIATCAFGLETDSYKHPENDFKKIAEKTINPSTFFTIVRYVLLSIMPKVMKKLDISLLDKHTKNFFRQTINETISYREKNNITRPDMIHLLMQAKKGNLKYDEDSHKSESNEKVLHWSDDEIIAQCLLFFLAGFDTSSSALAFAAYELAVNPDMQETLRREVIEMNESLSGKDLNYDNLHSMKNLDRFVMEVLRKWPPGVAVERSCVKDFTFELDGRKITIPKKSGLFFTIYAFHHDPKNFENPERFDPDRFAEQNIGQQNMHAYMPFGIGPRSCIGNRFALMNIKTVICKMLQKFSFEVCKKTQIPLQYKKTMVNISTEKGIWIRLKCIEV